MQTISWSVCREKHQQEAPAAPLPRAREVLQETTKYLCREWRHQRLTIPPPGKRASGLGDSNTRVLESPLGTCLNQEAFHAEHGTP